MRRRLGRLASVGTVVTCFVLASCGSAQQRADAPDQTLSLGSTGLPSTPAPTTSVPEPQASTSSPAPSTSGSMPSVTDPVTEIDETQASTTAPTPASSKPGASCLDTLPLERRVALLVWPSVYSDDWTTAQAVVGDLGLGGVLLMRPRLSESELTNRIAALDAVSELGVLVATDEEGGDVQRLQDIEPFPSQFEVSSGRSPDEARAAVAQHGAMVARVGVDVVLGPVVDVLPETGEPPLQRSRFFDGAPDVVAEYARAYLSGWQSAGLVPVLKHFPGHGSASGDTHDTAAVTPPLATMEQRDLVPYRALIGSGAAVMVGHLDVPGLTADEPAITSSAAIDYLRTTLGYGDVLVVSDALDMAAAGGPVPAVAVESIAAGVDVVLFTAPADADDVIAAIVGAVAEGRLPQTRVDGAAAKVLRMLEQRGGGCR